MIVTRGFGKGPYTSIVAAGASAMVTALERVKAGSLYVVQLMKETFVSVKPNESTVNKRG